VSKEIDEQGKKMAKINLPEWSQFLNEPCRYKVAYGGRGSGKSWAFAMMLLLQGIKSPQRILCAREVQRSLKDSVHQLLTDQIESMGLNDFYQITDTEIRGKNGTMILFAGLHNNSVTTIKSFEGVSRCWVEEAQTVSKRSWDILIPTIRKPDSEIWITFNPDLDTDETYKRFVVNPPSSASVKKVNWDQNPWFPETLREEKDQLKERDMDSYLNVWEGHTRQMLDGAVYANELRKAQEDGRIRELIIDKSIPVQLFFDLGWADMTSIWFVQALPGGEVRFIDFYQNCQKTIDHYVQVIHDRGYIYKDWWLPHDAEHKNMTGKSVKDILEGMGKPVRITPKLSIADGINAARLLMGRSFFDETRCADGLQNLRHYRYDVDANTKMFSNKPLHDQHSHAADSFRYAAVGLDENVGGWGKSINKPAKWIV
jgi:phage terminase large subunit